MVIWEHPWCYMTSHADFRDLKMSIRGSFKKPAQMGKKCGTKALSPHHYGEGLAGPRRTMCLLRAWAIWRTAHGGWAQAHPRRNREWEALRNTLAEDIRAVDGRAILRPPVVVEVGPWHRAAFGARRAGGTR